MAVAVQSSEKTAATESYYVLVDRDIVMQRRFKLRVDENQRITDAAITWIIGDILADDLATFFSQKVNSIRAAKASDPAPVLNTRTSTSRLSLFEPVTTDEVRCLLRTVPAKHCSLDPVPTWLVKKLTKDIIPVICHLHSSAVVCPMIRNLLPSDLD